MERIDPVPTLPSPPSPPCRRRILRGRRRPALVIAALAMLSACAAGPDYVRPQPIAGATPPFLGGAQPAVDATADADPAWWRLYDDPVLNALVADALAANTDLRVAIANLERARASLRGAKSDRLPQTTLNASVTENRVPDFQTFPGQDRTFRSADTGLDVSYEVDLFGRVRRGVEAARGDAQAAAADADAVRVAVVADTVRAYVDAAASAQQIAVAGRTVALLDRAARVTAARVEAGRSQRLDLIRIAALRDQRRADVPQLEAARDAALFQLATLTGRAPRDLPAAALATRTLPRLARPIPVGDGRALIARRPDVRAAERKLAADTARIGVATADLYPRIQLGGQIGTTSYGLSDIFGGGPLRWALGPLISWNFPNVAATRARIAGARAETQASLARFDGAVLVALQETETALASYAHGIVQRQALIAARDEARRAADVTVARQKEGTIDFLTVLDAQRTLADAQAALAASDRNIAFAQVDLFRALGGGWQTGAPTDVARAGTP